MAPTKVTNIGLEAMTSCGGREQRLHSGRKPVGMAGLVKLVSWCVLIVLCAGRLHAQGPVISTFGPSCGSTFPIGGSGFGATQGSSTVTFGGVAATVSTWNDTSIAANIPASLPVGAANIVVTVNGVASNSAAYSIPPCLASGTPFSGPTGTVVTLTGSRLGASQGSSTLTYNGIAASPTSWSDTQIVTPIPDALPAGINYATVTVNGISSENGPEFVISPTVTGLSPSFGPVGTSVTISGTKFGAAQGSSALLFCGATPTSWSDTSIVATIPDGAAGSCNARVTVNSITSDCCAAANVFDLSPPTLTGISPLYGSVGTTVSLSGTNFGSAQGTITFNGVPTSMIGGWGSNVATVPAGATTGNVVLTSSHGVASNGVPFIVISPTAFAPVPVNSTTPGRLQLRTWGVTTSTSYSSADLVNQPPGDFVVQEFDTPVGVPNTSGTWQSILGASFSIAMSQTAGATGTLFPEFRLFLNGPSGPPVCSVTGSTALTTTSTIYNLSCTPATDLTITPTDRYYLWVGVNSTATPTTSTRFQVTLGSLGRGRGTTSISVPLAAHVPTITGTNPASYVNAGAALTITGTDFGSAAGTVTFNGETVAVTSWSDTSIVATVPNDAFGRSSTVSVTAASTAQSAPWFIDVVPVINSLTPVSAAVGSSVIIAGTGFGPAAGNVWLGSTALAISSWTDTSITVTVPSGATSGNVIMEPPGGFDSNSVTFTVVSPPSIASISPNTGSVGTSVVIAGTNFGAAQGTVTFNGTAATVSTWSDTSITVSVPSGTTTGNVVVTAVGGVSSPGVAFTIIGPAIASLQPASGPVGTQVTIGGSHFGASQGTGTVTIGGTTAFVVSWSDGEIVAVVASGSTTGNAVVQQGGAQSNGVSFTVNSGPMLQLSVSNTPRQVDLTSPQNLDWIHWGRISPTTPDRKAGAAPLISDYALIDGQASSNTGVANYSWTDGNQQVAVSGTNADVYTVGFGTFQITVPADTTVKTLRLYAVAESGQAQFQASLSDGSVASITDESVNELDFGSVVYTLDFRASSPGQTLTVTLSPTEPWVLVGLEAATLTQHLPVVTLTSPTAGESFTAPSTVPLSAIAYQYDSLIGDVKFGGSDGSALDTPNPPFSANWGPLNPGHYSVTARATDSTGLFNTSAPVEVDSIGSGGSLSLQVAPTPASADLTAQGATDWVLWGSANPASDPASMVFDRKAGVTPVISNYAPIGSRFIHDGNGGNTPPAFTYEDGSVSSSTVTQNMLYVFDQNDGYSITVPADTTQRTLKLYAGVNFGQAKITAFLSDGSAAVVTDDSINSTVPSSGSGNYINAVYTISYSAASAGQTLTVRYTLEQSYEAPFIISQVPSGQLYLMAATLSGTTPVPLNVNIIGVQPASGGVGSNFTVSGSGFGAVQSDTALTLGGSPASIVSWSDTQIVATVPSLPLGAYPVTIYGVAGPQFTVVPGITSLSPSAGGMLSSVTISGSGFGATQGTGTVTFSGVSAAVTSWSDSSITAVVPYGATSGNVVVTTAQNGATNGVNFTVLPPVVNAISPTAGVVGNTISILGANFGSQQISSTVTLNGIPAFATSWSATQISAIVPSGVASGPVIVSVGGVASNANVMFTVGPLVANLNPSAGPVGSTVAISGANFGASQGLGAVTFNGVPATVTAWSDSQIHVVVPSATRGPVQVTANGVGSNAPIFTVTGSAALAPVLQLRTAADPAVVNLSDPVNLDWIVWGVDGSTPAATRQSGVGLISDFTSLPGTPDVFGDSLGNVPFTWTGGAPITTSATVDPTGVAGEVVTFDQNGGFQIAVPAGTSVETLNLYASFVNSAQLNISLSDASVPPISQTLTASLTEFNYQANVAQVYSIDFRAASPGQTLLIQLVSTDPNGSVSLQAATLQPHLPEVAILTPQNGQQFQALTNVPIGVNASQFDVAVGNVQISGTGNQLPAIQTQPYVWSWSPAAGHYKLQASATDAGGLVGTSAPVELDVIGSGGALSSSSAPYGSVDLTAQGTADWVFFTPREDWSDVPNPSNYAGYVHKGGVQQLISPPTPLRSLHGLNPFPCPASEGIFQFEDGVPDASEAGLDCSALNSAIGSGFEITVKADTTPRTLTLYVGIENGAGELTAFLSDGSAPPLLDTSLQSSSGGTLAYSINFQAASAGQTLTVRWLLKSAFNPNGGDFVILGHNDLIAATLNGPPIPISPLVTDVEPNPANPGQLISISGNSFGGATGTVTVGGIPASVASWSDTGIQAVVPAGACGGPVTVTSADGASGSQASLGIAQPLAIAPQAGGIVVGQTLQLQAQSGSCGGTASGIAWAIATSSSPGIATLSSGDQPVLTAVGAGSVTVSATVSGQTASATFTLTAQTPPAPPPPGNTVPPTNTNAVTVTNSLGYQTTYTSFNVGGVSRLFRSSGPGCSTCPIRGQYQDAFDQSGNMVSSANPNSAINLAAYDQNNNPTSLSTQVDANTYATSNFTYNNFGEVLTSTDPLGNVKSYSYDANGNLLSATSPAPGGNTAPSVTRFKYASNGDLIQTTDPLGRVTKMTYTPTGQVSSVTDPAGNVTQYQYDLRGNRTATIDPLQNQTSFAYDLHNRLIKITYPDNTTTSFTYDIRGRRTSVTDPNGATTSFVYDDEDRLISTSDAAGNATQYGYDTESQRTSITDAMGRVTTFVYDANGRVVQTGFPSSATESYTYDNVGNLSTKTDRNGQTTSYLYDLLNHLTNKRYPDSSGVSYTYDLAGRLTQATDATGTYGRAYDKMDRLIGVTTQYAFLPGQTFSNSYAYDAASQRTSFTGPDGSTDSYQYDPVRHLTTITDSAIGEFNLGYDASGRRTTLSRPNGVTTAYGYDSVSRPLSILHQFGGATIDGADYVYGGSDVLTRTNLLNNSTDQYAYDPLHQLTQVTEGGPIIESYGYDAVGNRLSSKDGSSYSYNASNELAAHPTATYTYDNNGNVLTKTVAGAITQYTWDFENRLASVILPGAGGTVAFKYDPFDRRVQKSLLQGTNVTATNYLYDEANDIEEVDQNGNRLVRYVQGDRIDEPLAQLRLGTTSFYEQNALGSVTSLSGATGALANTYVYDSFGNLTASTGSTVNPFQYTARESDPETGLMYYRARYYDPQVGRFISEDRLRFMAGPNFYAYVGNSPVVFSDPLGLCRTGTCPTGTSLLPPGPPPPLNPEPEQEDTNPHFKVEIRDGDTYVYDENGNLIASVTHPGKDANLNALKAASCFILSAEVNSFLYTSTGESLLGLVTEGITKKGLLHLAGDLAVHYGADLGFEKICPSGEE